MASTTIAFVSTGGLPVLASSLTNRCQIAGASGASCLFKQQEKIRGDLRGQWTPKPRVVELGRRGEWVQRRSRRNSGVCVASFGKLADAKTFECTGDGKELPAAPGVYAVHDKEGNLQYVGVSRRIATSILGHMQDLPELCGSVKIAVIDAPDKAALTEAWQQWVQEHIDTTGQFPPGNAQKGSPWTAKKSRAKPELKMMPSPDKELNITLTELIDKVVKSIPVVAFIKGTRLQPQCGFSHRVLTILNENQVNYEVVNVLDEYHNPGLREAIKSYSNWPTIPQLYVGGEFIGGADIISDMAEKGEIKSLFKK